MKIKSRVYLDLLLSHGYAKSGKAYSKELASFKDGDVVIQIIVDPYYVEEEVILNICLDGIDIADEEGYFLKEYHVDIWILEDEIQLLRNLDIME